MTAPSYRTKAPDVATVEELQAEVERLRAKLSRRETRKQRREERRKRRAEWWKENRGMIGAIAIATCAGALGTAHLSAKHESAIACAPAKVAYGGWRVWDRRVVCTNGKVVER